MGRGAHGADMVPHCTTGCVVVPASEEQMLDAVELN